jgi:tetratricopeptide (TPR) repeat protein
VLGDLDRALESAQEGLGLARTIGDPRLVARSLHEVGESFATLGNPREATVAYAEAIDGFREAGESPFGTMVNLGDLALSEGQFQEAEVRLAEARELLAAEGLSEGRRVADRLMADYNYAVALLHLGRHSEAAELLKEVLVGMHDLGFREGVAWALIATAILLMTDEGSTAARLLGAADVILDETDTQIGPTERRLHDSLVCFITDHDLANLRALGREMSEEQAVELAVGSID